MSGRNSKLVYKMLMTHDIILLRNRETFLREPCLPLSEHRRHLPLRSPE
jgi:hypothetical protein